MVIICDILLYENCANVSGQVYKSVYDKGVILFRDEVVRYLLVRDRLTQTLLDTIAEERREKTVEK